MPQPNQFVTPSNLDFPIHTTYIRGISVETAIPGNAIKVREPQPGARVILSEAELPPNADVNVLARDSRVIAYSAPIVVKQTGRQLVQLWKEQDRVQSISEPRSAPQSGRGNLVDALPSPNSEEKLTPAKEREKRKLDALAKNYPHAFGG